MSKSLSIVTVNFESGRNLFKTVESVARFRQHCDFPIEYILIDGGSADLDKDYVKGHFDVWVCEPDNGIYDAMNKGIDIANGDLILFLNSGDEISTSGRVKEIDVGIFECCFEGSRKPFHGRPLWMGTPYCHQQVVFSNKPKSYYDTSYLLSSDLDFMLTKGSYRKLQKISGIKIMYDLSGVSQTNSQRRDLEIIQILKLHNFQYQAFIFKIKSSIAHIVKSLIL